MIQAPGPDPEQVTAAASTVRIPAALRPQFHRGRRDGRRSASRAPHRRSRIRAQLLVFAATLLIALVLAPEALANFITPKSGGSPNANEIASLYRIILYMAAVVFVLVEGALVYSVYKFRAKRGAIPAQIHGNTSLEIGWTVGAALILVALTVVTFIKLPSIVDPPNS